MKFTIFNGEQGANDKVSIGVTTTNAMFHVELDLLTESPLKQAYNELSTLVSNSMMFVVDNTPEPEMELLIVTSQDVSEDTVNLDYNVMTESEKSIIDTFKSLLLEHQDA